MSREKSFVILRNNILHFMKRDIISNMTFQILKKNNKTKEKKKKKQTKNKQTKHVC